MEQFTIAIEVCLKDIWSMDWDMVPTANSFFQRVTFSWENSIEISFSKARISLREDYSIKGSLGTELNMEEESLKSKAL